MVSFNNKTIAGLDVIELPGDPDGPVIILFHGYGADASDLAPLSGVYRGPPRPTWIFPNGPLEISLGMGYTGRAWFPLDIERLTAALHAGEIDKVIQAFPAEFSEIRKVGERLIAELNIPLSTLYLGGFSQGAVIATEIALHASENLAGLLVLSGILINEHNWRTHVSTRKGMPFFQSHGKEDPLLPVTRAQALESLLLQGGLQGKLHLFSGGHEIPQEILLEIHQFFTKFSTSR